MGAKVNIGDTWKDVSAIKINIGDNWKTVNNAWINIGDSWKQWYATELDGLIHLLDAGNPQSYPGTGTTWTDLSSNGKNSTLSTVSFSNSALTFNGSSSYTSGSVITGKTSAFTIEIVFKPTNISNAGQVLYHNGSDANSTGFGIGINTEGTTDGKFRLLYAAVAWVDTGIATANNTWYHFTVVIESDRSSKVYKDGTLAFTGTTYNLNTPTLYHFVGKNNWGSASQRCFEGSIASVRMYNRVLTSTEVSTVYNLHKRT